LKKTIGANFFIILTVIIFILTGTIAVVTAWGTGLHLYDLRLSYSSYVALRVPTAILYFISAVSMVFLMTMFLRKMRIKKSKRIVYSAMVFCILGTAMFPCNADFSRITTFIHNCFAIGLMSTGTISFLISVLFGKRIQRIPAVLSLVYAVAFIIALCMRFEPLYETFFIWEILFLLLMMFGLFMEQFTVKKSDPCYQS
jgi:hypothetical protein